MVAEVGSKRSGDVHDDGALHGFAARPHLRLLLQCPVDPLIVLRKSYIRAMEVSGEIGGLLAEVGEGRESGDEEVEGGGNGRSEGADGGAEGIAVDKD